MEAGQRVRTKQQMYRMLLEGCFGNRFRIWTSAEELRRAVAEGYDWLIGVRCADTPGAPYYHHLSPEEGIALGASLERLGHRPVYYEASPDQWIVLQGEVSREVGGLYLRYSTLKTHMRAALKQDRHVMGVEARLILDHALSPASREDFEMLFQTYVDHVVEFTAYAVPVGDLPGRTACVWEVRAY